MPSTLPPANREAKVTIGTTETAEILGITRQTLYNYLHTGNPRAPKPLSSAEAEKFGHGKRAGKLVWLRRDVVTHVEAMSSGLAYVGVQKCYDGWVPTVTFHGRRWDGQTRDSIHEAFDAAREYFERTKRR